MTEIVIFRRWKDTGSVIALFPEIPSTYYNCESYMHIGQHSGADYHHVIRKTTPVSQASSDVLELKKELESIGYELVVKNKATYAMHNRARKRYMRDE